MEKLLLFVLIIQISYKHTSAYLKIENEISQPNYAFDQQLYENVLNPEKCQKQLSYLRTNNTLLLARFLDAGIRIPKGILEGNFRDMGNYHQCLRIQETLQDLTISGKYCTINVPFNQDLSILYEFPEWPDIPWPEINPEIMHLVEETRNLVRKLRSLYSEEEPGGTPPNNTQYAEMISRLAHESLHLAMCIPRACTTRDFFEGFMFNLTAIGFKYEDDFCRLPDDKPWVVADYIAIAVFSLIGVVTILSTAYDIRHNIILQRDPKQINKLLQSFSVYTNTRRLVNYTPLPGSLECIDGIRVIATLWVLLGHTNSTQFNDKLANLQDPINWITTFGSLWVVAGPITVDTFFLMSGLLLVYTTTANFTRMKLLKNLHLFYLNRLLRMFPILAAFVLLQTTTLNWIGDGPYWNTVSNSTNDCRVFWWSTLLHVQNLVNCHNMCLNHTWYLAIDVQLHILSPLVLFWLLGTRKWVAWVALTAALATVLVSSTIYNVINEFAVWPLTTSRTKEELLRYMIHYYTFTLTRSAPFFIGMIYGYILHLCRGKPIVMSKISVLVLWLCSIMIMFTVFASINLILQFDWDNQTVDTIINCVSRPAWAIAVGWMIFACVHGFGGPLNWFLSLRLWKFPSRLTYAMYITHYNMMLVVNGTAIMPTHFTVFKILYRSFADLVLTFVVSYVVTVVLDSPCSTLIKHFLGGGSKIHEKPWTEEDKDKQLDDRLSRININDEKRVKQIV